MDSKKLKSIEKCPIVDSIIEIRFETSIDSNAVFGVIYGQILDMYKGKVQNLPESQLPPAVRESNPALRYKPLYKIEGDKTIIQIGPNVICLGAKIPYKGWDEFSSIFKKIINKLLRVQIITRVTRLGIRYVDFFPGDIKNNITMKLVMNEKYTPIGEFIRSTIIDEGFYNVIQFYNNVNYNNVKTKEITVGSLIDIDTSKEYSDSYFLEHLEDELNIGHDKNKKLFVATLEPDFLESLNPQYYD
jgi:hypothetical protein